MRFRGILPVAAAILLAAAGSAAAEPTTWSGTARVIDGDTISVRRQRIRIAAIDACELKQTGIQNGKVWPCGAVARSYLRKMIDGKHVRCEIIDKDQYRRLVGQCFIADTDIGLAMVNAGLAESMLRYLPRSHSIMRGREQGAGSTFRHLVGGDRKPASLPARESSSKP